MNENKNTWKTWKIVNIGKAHEYDSLFSTYATYMHMFCLFEEPHRLQSGFYFEPESTNFQQQRNCFTRKYILKCLFLGTKVPLGLVRLSTSVSKMFENSNDCNDLIQPAEIDHLLQVMTNYD